MSDGPKKFLIIGTPAAGQASAAGRLGTYTGTRVLDAPEGESWIVATTDIDAVGPMLAEVNLVLWLDYSPLACTFSALGGVLGGNDRPLGQLLSDIWAIPKEGRPRIEKQLEALRPEQTVFRLTRKRDLDFWFARFATRLGV